MNENLVLSILRKKEGLIWIDVEDVVVPEKLPVRMHSEEEYLELKRSLQSEGVLIPLVVIRDEAEGKYYLADGRNRLRAAKELGLKKVPAVVYASVMGKEEVQKMAIELEVARRHLTKDEWEGLRARLEKVKREHLLKEKELREQLLSKFAKTFGASPVKELSDLEKKLAKLEEEKSRLEKEKQELEKKVELLERSLEELREQLEEQQVQEAPPFDLEEERPVLSEEELHRIRREAQLEVYKKLREVEKELIRTKEELNKKKNEVNVLKNEIRFVEKNRDYMYKLVKSVCELDVVLEHLSLIKMHLLAVDRIFEGLAELGKVFYEHEWAKIIARIWSF